MALIKCPECGKEVSDKTYKCPNCGFVLNKPKRSITGKIFNFIFIAFNGFMIIWIVTTAVTVTNSGAGAGGLGMGIGMLIFLWILIGLPLALMNYLTRPKAYE